jgi:segregation and condensation protein B
MDNSTQVSLASKLESILFAAGKPLRFKHLAEVCGVTIGDVEAVLGELQQRYSQPDGGLNIIIHQGEVALTTNPDNTDLVRQFLKKEELGELTRPQLEALSVIAYRGPITKAELEQIRGVNCSLILRNLQIRGLVETVSEEAVIPRYQVTIDFLRFLGVKSAQDLPNYESLSTHANLEQILATAAKS